MQKQLGGGTSLFPLTPGSPSSREVRVRTQGRNLEAGADAEAMEEWLALRGLLKLISYSTLDYQPRSGTATVTELSPLTIILN